MMKPVVVFGACIVALSLPLTGCDRPMNKVQHGLPMPVQTYAHVERLNVGVGRVDVVIDDDTGDDYSADFPVSLDDHAVAYFQSKLIAQGGDGRLIVRVEDSYVEHERVASQHGVFEKIGVDHVDQYTMNLSVRLEHQDVLGRVIYGRAMQARKIVNISEHDSLVEKDQKRFNAIEELFGILDPEVNRIVRSEMNL